jgi:hypothetical protein
VKGIQTIPKQKIKRFLSTKIKEYVKRSYRNPILKKAIPSHAKMQEKRKFLFSSKASYG